MKVKVIDVDKRCDSILFSQRICKALRQLMTGYLLNKSFIILILFSFITILVVYSISAGKSHSPLLLSSLVLLLTEIIHY